LISGDEKEMEEQWDITKEQGIEGENANLLNMIKQTNWVQWNTFANSLSGRKKTVITVFSNNGSIDREDALKVWSSSNPYFEADSPFKAVAAMGMAGGSVLVKNKQNSSHTPGALTPLPHSLSKGPRK
jgi:hypothetical protein